jgi:hypothetical protein
MALCDYEWLPKSFSTKDIPVLFMFFMDVLRWAIPIKSFWNCHIYETVNTIGKILDVLPPDELLKFAAEGLSHNL